MPTAQWKLKRILPRNNGEHQYALIDTETHEELAGYTHWDNSRSAAEADEVRAAIEQRWTARGYIILDEDAPAAQGKALITPADVLALRKRHKLTQAEFAVLLGVKTLAVNRWENGVALPDGPGQRLLALLREDEKMWKKLEGLK